MIKYDKRALAAMAAKTRISINDIKVALNIPFTSKEEAIEVCEEDSETSNCTTKRVASQQLINFCKTTEEIIDALRYIHPKELYLAYEKIRNIAYLEMINANGGKAREIVIHLGKIKNDPKINLIKEEIIEKWEKISMNEVSNANGDFEKLMQAYNNAPNGSDADSLAIEEIAKIFDVLK